MSSNFQLAITADSRNLAADLVLKDGFGVQVAQRTVDFGRDPLRTCHDQLFDTRNWLRRLYPTREHQEKLKEIGVVIARDIFGSEIFDALRKNRGPRRLRIVFDGADPAGNLAAALARAPWEIARRSLEADSLAETNLRLCIGDDAKRPTTDSLPLVADEPLRILFVFAAARSSRPLAARRERWQLRSLFETKIFRDHNVIVDFLTHGVTRKRLIEQVQTRGGYHILHWSGHGHQNLLELVKADGELDRLSGEELLELFHDAGGYVPRLAFLSACHSGAVAATDMESLLRAARGGDGYEREASPEEADALGHKPGFTGTAHALLAGGVPTVVAMRFSVGDAYARDLATQFYDGLLADRAPKDAASALAQARKALLAPGADQRLYSPCDHATPILYANEPVAFGLLAGVWSGESVENEQLRQVKTLLDNISMLPPQMQEKLRQMSPELRAKIETLPPALQRADPRLLLRQLTAVGLVDEWRDGVEDKDPESSCHELARERIRCWMAGHDQDQGGWSENAIRLAYGERLAYARHELLHEDMSAALEAGARAVVYFVQAGAYERMGTLANRVVTSATDPKFAERLLLYLQAAANAAPEGGSRWTCLYILADALMGANRSDQSLEYYQQAADLARISAEAGGDTSRQAWSDLAMILGHWAFALADTGNLSASREKQVEASEANSQAGRPLVDVIVSELEALRIDIMQGQANAALPQIEERLSKIEGWWTASRAGLPTPEAPDREFLARAVIGALDIAKDAHYALEQWEAALKRIDAMIKVKQELKRPPEDIARDRMNRANMLCQLKRYSVAKPVLEACLDIFENDPVNRARVLNSLAILYDDIGDLPQAITQERRALTLANAMPEPRVRAMSHGNLANYLWKAGGQQNLAESARHLLAGLVYDLATGSIQLLRTTFRSYVILFRTAASAGTEPNIPRLTELLADPAFAALKEWLVQRQIDLDNLQAAIDQFLDQARQAAKQSPAQ